MTVTALSVLLLACITMLSPLPLPAQDAPKAPKASDQKALLLEKSKPGPEHAALAKFTGTWELTLTAGAGNHAATSQGNRQVPHDHRQALPLGRLPGCR